MPIYEYRCDACGHQEEHLQKVSEALINVCPSCQKEAYRKLLSAAGFQLKGSGWYATDFRNRSSASPKKDEGKSESKSESGSESKSESKGESKSESKGEAVASSAGACAPN